MKKKRFRGKKALMAKALVASLGNVTQATAKCDIDRTTHYLWLNTDPDYKAFCEDLPELEVDFYETALRKLIQSGNAVATIFALKCKGKDRDWIDHPDITPGVNILNLNAPLTEIEKDDLLQELGGLPKPVKEVKVLEANDGKTSKTE